MRLSIVTPTFNAAPYLPQLLACVDQQTYADVEHVVVDGSSTDGTQDILGGAARPGRQIQVGKDRSMYDAINKGIGLTTGDVISCLNADDLYFPDTTSRVMRFFERHPDVDIVYGDQLSVLSDPDSFDLNVMAREYAERWGDVLVYISQPAVFMRRRVIDTVGLFDADLKAAGDFDYWFRAFEAGMRFHAMRFMLTIVRLHGSNLSLTPKWHEEHEALKDKYVGIGSRRQRQEDWRLLKRKFWLNRFTLPLLARFPSEYVHVDWTAYFRYLVTVRPTPTPILSIRLPYYVFECHRALSLEKPRWLPQFLR